MNLLKNLLLLALTAWLFYGRLLYGIIFLPVLWPLLLQDAKRTSERRSGELNLQFREALQSMKTAMRAGYAAENAVTEALRDLTAMYGEDSAMASEFRRIQNEIRMQIPIEKALAGFAVRAGTEDIRDFSVVFRTAKRSGGDMIAIMDNTAEAIGERELLRQELKAVLAAKMMEWRVMTIIPYGIILYMRFSFAEFMSVLYGNAAGRIVMSAALLIFAAAYFWGQKTVRIEV